MNSPFPASGLLPKSETGALAFVKKYPEYDGRNICLAILDTGVDPGAPGMQVTSHGLPKIVDIVDCTGSGDVILSASIKPVEEAGLVKLKGLSGKDLIVSKSWNNPSGEYRLGLKPAVDLFPKNLVQRIADRKKEKFYEQHKKLLAIAIAKLNEFNKAHVTPITEVEIEEKANLEAEIACLKKEWDDYEDPLLAYDCVVFHDGTDYRAVLDLNQTGDLRDIKPITNYKKHQEYLCFDEEDKLNFSVNIYDEGKVLSIVTVAGSHGTHVAAIAAANHPEDPVLNGVAPGAQIVSLKIGDTRLGSMETGCGLSRALKVIVDAKCEVCNMSYGEEAGTPNAGEWIKMLREELIEKRQIVFVSSAGNAGACISTVGAPGGTTTGVIGVGAYVTKEMVEAEYALLDSVREIPFTWSSQGPTFDGDRGVCVYAPGAAITSVPQYFLKPTQLMNGTSMAGPNAAGSVCLLLSAWKKLSIKYTPYSVRKSIVNTAKDIQDPLQVGLFQVEPAFEWLKKYHTHIDVHVNMQVSFGNRSNARGLYLREACDFLGPLQEELNIQPVFKKDDPVTNPEKLALDMRLVLTAQESFVKVPDFLMLNNGGRDLQIRVDASKLESGFYYTEVKAFDSACVEKGAVLTIPVCILKPTALEHDASWSAKLNFSPGIIRRSFIQPPEGAKWAKLFVRFNQASQNARLIVTAMQIKQKVPFSATKQVFAFAVKGDQEVKDPVMINLNGRETVELCFAQFWSSLGTNEIDIRVEFHGIEFEPKVLYRQRGFELMSFFAPLRKESFNASVNFTAVKKQLNPSKVLINPLDSRDILFEDKSSIHELISTYSLSVKEDNSTIKIKPFIEDLLYDSPFDSFLVMIHDVNKRRIFMGDVFSKATKLNKGSYTIRVQLRHTRAEVLENLKSLVLTVEQKLSKSVSVSFYEELSELFAPEKKPLSSTQMKVIAAKESHALYLDLLGATLPDEVSSGDILVGEISFGSNGLTYKSEIALVASVSSAPKEESNSDAEPKSLAEKVKDLTLQWLNDKKATVAEKEKVIASLLKDYPEDLQVLSKTLDFVASKFTTEEEKAKNYAEALKHAKKVLEKINMNDVLGFLGEKAPLAQSKEYTKKKEKMNESKQMLADAFYRLSEFSMLAGLSGDDNASKEFEAHFSNLTKFVDVNSDVKYVYLYAAREMNCKRFANAMKAVTSFIKKEYNNSAFSSSKNVTTFFQKDLLEKSKELGELQKLFLLKQKLEELLAWDCWLKYEKEWMKLRFQKEYELF